MFSGRLPPALGENALSRVAASLAARGITPLDLTASNPTAVGLTIDGEILARALAHPDAVYYRPDPRGAATARELIAAQLLPRAVPADNIFLTASTSEAYALLFKLLCDPGDQVLVPQPSYPLFDWLTQLEGITALPYAIDTDTPWTLPAANVASCCQPPVRALLVVNPNNPTGSVLNRADLRDLTERLLTAGRSTALIGDEVFFDYPWPAPGDEVFPPLPSVLDQQELLTFSLGGLSKSFGLPQLKLSWIALAGPPLLVAEAKRRLELIADAYLSVSSPVALALEALIPAGRQLRQQIRARIADNLTTLRGMLAEFPACSILPGRGGWTAALRLPSIHREHDLAATLLAQDHLHIHPGYFYDFSGGTVVVLSLLVPPNSFHDGLRCVLARANA